MAHGLLTALHRLMTHITRDDDGQTLVEYALIILFISIALIGVLGVLAATVGGFFTTLIGSL